MRRGEVDQYKCVDIRTDGGVPLLWSPAVRCLPSTNFCSISARFENQLGRRVVPIHPLPIELGLLDRKSELTG